VTPPAVPSPHPEIRVEQEGHVTTVTLDRPHAKNACTGDMWVSLGEIFRALSYSGTRVVVLTGAGGEFCAGADLSGSADGPREPRDGNRLDPMRALADAVVGVHGCAVPTIAKVDGVCVGGGFGLALACDLLWCSDRARFSAIYAKRGLSLDFGTSWLLRQRIGVHRAKELAFTAEMIDAARAREIGFVNAVVPAASFDTATAELAATIAGGPPVALSSTKRQLDFAGTSSLVQALELETLAQNVNQETSDLREALTAWAERRPPEFRGR